MTITLDTKVIKDLENGPGANPGILVTGFFVASCIYLWPPMVGAEGGNFLFSRFYFAGNRTPDTKITITYMRVENKQID